MDDFISFCVYEKNIQPIFPSSTIAISPMLGTTKPHWQLSY